jgi:DNA-binding CsgD family transcriptional regulator
VLGSEILAESDGLRLVNGALAFSATPHNVVKQWIGATLAFSRRITLEVPRALCVARPSGRRPYVLRSLPLNDHEASGRGSHAPAAILFVLDTDHGPGDIESILGEMFGLSPTEATLATLISIDGDLNHTCEQMRIRKTTARTHLQSIFRKMEITRQAQLVRRVQQLGRLCHIQRVD